MEGNTSEQKRGDHAEGRKESRPFRRMDLDVGRYCKKPVIAGLVAPTAGPGSSTILWKSILSSATVPRIDK